MNEGISLAHSMSGLFFFEILSNVLNLLRVGGPWTFHGAGVK